MAFNIPVLLIIFNRQEHAKKVLNAIKKISPSKFYIAADGPRKNRISDTEKCGQTRDIIKLIDWPCQVTTLFREENLGCGKGPAEAISWFFSNEEYGIILEDDCLPDESFFFFCQELLIKYKQDTRIMLVAGTNPNVTNVPDKENSYYFSQVGHMWGWATWKRAWDLYDFTMKDFEKFSLKGYFKYFYPNLLIRKYLQKKLTQAYKGEIEGVWDYQWDFTRLINSGLSIIPNNNLIENIGFGVDATHTFSNNNFFNVEVKEMTFPLKHPLFVIRDTAAEIRYFNKLFKWIFKRKLLSVMGFKDFNFKG